MKQQTNLIIPVAFYPLFYDFTKFVIIKKLKLCYSTT